MSRMARVDVRKLGYANCRECPIRYRMEFGPLPLEAFDDVPAPIEHMVYEDGAYLFHQGAVDDGYLFSIRNGWVKLVYGDEDGDERIVRLMGPGSVLGQGLLFDKPKHYSENAVALGEVDVCRIPVSTMQALSKEYPAMSGEIGRNYEEHLKRANQVIVSFSTGRLHDRIVHVLRFQAKEFADAHGHFALLSGADYAELVGASEESVSRVLASLKRENVLARQDDGLFVFNAS